MLTDLLGVSPQWAATFLLIVARLSVALVVVPLFGARSVPLQAKIGLSLLLALVVLPLSAPGSRTVPTDLLPFAAAVGTEAMIGLTIGIATMFVFEALEMGAGLVGVQMGFGMSQVLDPLTGAQSEVMHQFYRLLVTLVFFAIDGHHIVLVGLVRSFTALPPGAASMSTIAGGYAVPFFSGLFVVALRVALPVTGALLLTDLAMALAARTVPQLNVLVVGFPVKIAVGLLALAASIPVLVTFIGSTFHTSLPQAYGFLRP